jgi:formate dehydrogenase major subunit
MAKINGIEVEAKEPMTILDVIRKNKLANVPNLYVPEVGRAQAVTDNMVVNTESEAVKKDRKTNLEELLSNHKADCYAPCRLGCPAGVDIQGYIALGLRGQYTEANKLLKETNPLPMICGKVCAKPCEDVCRRNYIDAPVDIKNIKRFIAKKDLEANGKYYIPATGKDTGKKVAIIGSGPAGLSAAFFLRKQGHGVTIYEMMPKAGGMMRYGIPEYRLPKADLQEEIDSILNMGASIEFNQKLGTDFTFESLKKSGYDAIFVGIGAQLGSTVRTPGGELKGVIQGVDFLRDVELGVAKKLHGKVFIIGGGNTAIDASRTALRFGAESVSIVYRRTEAEMPAAVEEIHDAKEENIALNILTAPVEYKGENGSLTTVKLIKMKLGTPDSSGRRRPVVMEGSEYEEPVDFIIEAIGQSIDTSDLEDLALDRWNSIDADESTFTTNIDGVFSGGDVVTGPSIIISAVAHGRKAAHSMDLYLRGQEIVAEDRIKFKIAKEDFGKLRKEDFEDHPKMERKDIERIDSNYRVTNFDEVELGFSEEDFKEEVQRCLECGCQDVMNCSLKELSHEYSADKHKLIIHDVKETFFTDVASPFPTETENPFIIRNFSKCILCGSCVQACNDIQVNNAIDFGKQGTQTKIIAGADQPLKDSDCVFCGECVQVCPVGALTEKNVIYRGTDWDDKTIRSTCTYCGVGCQINLHVKDNEVIRITGNEASAPNHGSLCVKGRYGFDFISSLERLKHPLIKYNGEFKEASWDEAFEHIANRFSEIIEKNGPNSIGALTSARVSNEENYIVQKFARGVLKTNNVDHCARL